MAKAPNLITTPFFILAYSQRKLFSIDDEKGTTTLPLFTNAESAEKYRRFFTRKFRLKLQVCIADKLEKGLNMVECAIMACETLKYAVIDPQVPSTKADQPELKPIKLVLTSLMSQYRRGRKAHSRPSPHKK